MPRGSCRDVDEACDWFFQDINPANILVASIVHFEEQHAESLRTHMKTKGPAKVCEDVINVWRPD